MDIQNTIKVLLSGCAEHTDIKEIEEKLKKIDNERRPIKIKLGLDPSAPDIHLGHTVLLRKIRQLQNLGHEAIIIIGDFTGKIGDPTGKSKTRKELTEEEVMKNAETYKSQLFKILDKKKTIIRFNSEWLSKLNLKDVINLASFCTVAKMIERDDFKKRFTNHQSIALHEFLYPLLQGYDSVAIKADIELGGTDQTFNVLMGRDIQRNYNEDVQLTFFFPLLEGIDGVQKMSKSLNNYIGIDEEANVIYTKVMKIPDNLIVKYYELCTDLHPDNIKDIKYRLEKENPRDIKMQLAKEITSLYSSNEEAEKAEVYFKTVFQEQKLPETAVEILLPENDENFVVNFVDNIMNTGDFKSKSEIRRLFLQNAVRVDDKIINDIADVALIENDSVAIKIGKSHIYKLIRRR